MLPLFHQDYCFYQYTLERYVIQNDTWSTRSIFAFDEPSCKSSSWGQTNPTYEHKKIFKRMSEKTNCYNIHWMWSSQLNVQKYSESFLEIFKGKSWVFFQISDFLANMQHFFQGWSIFTAPAMHSQTCPDLLCLYKISSSHSRLMATVERSFQGKWEAEVVPPSFVFLCRAFLLLKDIPGVIP